MFYVYSQNLSHPYSRSRERRSLRLSKNGNLIARQDMKYTSLTLNVDAGLKDILHLITLSQSTKVALLIERCSSRREFICKPLYFALAIDHDTVGYRLENQKIKLSP